ncbi:MAG TPA: hypothetical protein VGF55_29045 [Gemmataceae bacterium]|jgi:hypothetical protein
MTFTTRALLPAALLALAASPAAAQDRVTYRDRATKGPQTAAGKIESETLAGVKVGSRTIPAGDVVEIVYDVPAIKLDYPRAAAAEARGPAEAAPVYEGMLRVPAVQNNKAVKRYIEYKLALLAAARADEGPEQLQKAITALDRFRKDHPDSWELVPVTRALARLYQDHQPPDLDAARKAYEELAAAAGAPADLKAECTFQAIDLLLSAGRADDAKRRLAALPASDPRTKVYEIGCQAGTGMSLAAAKQLEDLIDKTTDRGVKAAAYNMLGDIYRRDPKTKKDAVYAYLWVDAWYNDDPAEVGKADGRLADLFGELKDDERAKKFRDKVRGK